MKHLLTLESFLEMRELSNIDDWALDESLNEAAGIDAIKLKSEKSGRKIKLTSALKYPKGSPTRKQAEEIVDALRKKQTKIEDKPESEIEYVKGDEDLKKLMPNADVTKKLLSEIPAEEKKDAITAIDKIADEIMTAKEEGRPVQNTNLCSVTIPGTNMYCDANKNIPREKMPQFRGKPEKGSAADKMPRDSNGEVETSHLFDKMLDKEGIKISKPTEIDASSLKATQAELVGPKVVGMTKVLAKNCEKDKCSPDEMKDWNNITGPVYVSNDGYVVDGHHRWAAIVSHNLKNPDKQIPMKVRVIDDKIDSIIPKANKFAEDIGIAAKTGKEGTKGGEPAAQTKKK
jgi:hypothetical protein